MILRTIQLVGEKMVTLPKGFSDLVGVVIEDWGWGELPKKNSDIWDALLYPIFLGETVRSAQAGYVKKVLDPFLKVGAAQTAGSDPDWSRRVLAAIETELNTIRGTPGKGLKMAILKIVQEKVGPPNYDLGRTLHGTLQFFKAHNINVQKIKRIRNDRKETGDLIAYAAYEIHDVGLTKAVLWLYDCGIADDFAPPNAQNRRFLEECGYDFKLPKYSAAKGWQTPSMAEDRQIFAQLCQYMREVANLVSRQLKKPITAKQAQLAAWYLESCRGLPGMERRRRRLTPRVFLNFLESRGWNIDNLSERLGNVERLEDLGEELRSFVSP
ncbi:hypothetical protein ES706_03514 [subsurface metagenome]